MEFHSAHRKYSTNSGTIKWMLSLFHFVVLTQIKCWGDPSARGFKTSEV